MNESLNTNRQSRQSESDQMSKSSITVQNINKICIKLKDLQTTNFSELNTNIAINESKFETLLKELGIVSTPNQDEFCWDTINLEDFFVYKQNFDSQSEFKTCVSIINEEVDYNDEIYSRVKHVWHDVVDKLQKKVQC